jgi:O-antigen/teichoic acid export membrane protein
MSIIKQIKGLSKDTLYYGLGGAVAKFIAFFTAPILTRIFTPEDYGMMDFIATTFALFMMFAGVNIITGIYRYYYEVKSSEEQNKLVSTGFIFTLMMGIIFLFIMFGLKPLIVNYLSSRSSIDRNYSLFLTLVFLRAPFNLIQSYLLSLFRLRREPKKYVVISIVQVLLNFLLIILFIIILKYHLVGAFLAGLVSNILITIITFFLYFKSLVFSFSRTLFKKVLHYSLPQFPSVIINWGILQVNRFFLYEYGSETELGYFSVSLKIAIVIQMVIMAFRAAWGPFVMQVMQKPDHKNIYIRFYRLILIAFTIIAFLVFIVAKPILYILAPPEYLPAFPIIVFLVFAHAFDISHQIFGIGIGIMKKTQYHSYAQTITFIFVLFFNYIFIVKFGAFGAAIALVSSYFIKALLMYQFSQRLYPIKYDLGNILHFLVIFGFSIFVSYAIYPRDFSSTIIISIAAFIAVSVYVYTFWFLKEERIKIKQLLFSYFKKTVGNYL